MKRAWVSIIAACGALGMSAVAGAASLPTTMRAVAIEKTGGPEVLTVHTLAVPEIGANEVLIALHTASVAVWDADFREKLSLTSRRHFPFVMGSDGAGEIAAAGASVKKFKVGDRVYAYCWDNPKGGFYAEYIAVAPDCVARIPQGLTMEAAGALGASGLTALQGLDGALHIKPGEKLIIHGGSGAVGTLAVQIAKARGAQVLATASGDDGVALVKRLGADAAVDGRKGDIAAAALAFAPQGVDAVLALAAGDGLTRCIAALRIGGRAAYPHGIESAPQPRAGIKIVAYDAIEGPEDAELAHLNEVVESRKFEVPVDSEFPLADASKAHERLARGHVLGKILLRIR